MKNLLLLLAIIMLPLASSIGQEVNFEIPIITSVSGGATFTTITNPDQTGLNKTATCGQFGRESATWWALVDVPCSFSIPANESRYVHILVKYDAQPDFGVRLNTEGATVRTSNTYVDLGKWQDLVFEFTGGTSGKAVTQLRLLADMGYENDPVGQVLNNTDKFGLIDEIIVNDDDTPRSLTTDINEPVDEKNYILYSGNGKITFESQAEEVMQIRIYNASGVLVKSYSQNKFKYQTPSSGLYLVKIGNTTEKVIVR